MIETEHGNYEVIKDYKEALEIKLFNERYVSFLDKYTYVVGDFSADMLRFRGFSEEKRGTITDYLIESCTPNAPYFVLKRINKE